MYGGVGKWEQKKELENYPCIVTGTTGRVMDFLSEKRINMDNVKYLVLDEADRMLDMGFLPDIEKILSYCSKDRQTVMFSATWPSSIQKLAQKYMRKETIQVVIGREGESLNNSLPDGSVANLKGSTNVTQIVDIVHDGKSRDDLLVKLLKDYHNTDKTNKIIVFVLYKREADRIEKFLWNQGFYVGSIHGDKEQFQRSQTLNEFKSGEISILVATDVAARGLDIPNVEYVINYSFPLTIENYVHRIGRTGRANSKGISHSFFVPQNDSLLARDLATVLKNSKQPVPSELASIKVIRKSKSQKQNDNRKNGKRNFYK